MLTSKEELFARCVVEGKDYTESYRTAYPNSKAKEKTKWEFASRLAKKPEVAARIKELRNELVDKTIMTAQERLEWLTSLIKNNEEITTDKLRALDIMNKMTGEYVAKVEADVKNEVSINIELTDD